MNKARNVLEQITEYENLLYAKKKCSKGKKNKNECLRFENDLCTNLLAIETEFLSGEYESGAYREYFCRIPQTRLIQVSRYRDRVAQWAIYAIIGPILDRHYIYDSYACRVGKGANKATGRIQYWLQQIERKPDSGNWVCGKIDAAKFFYRLDHDVIMEVMGQYVDDEAFMRVYENIIRCRHTPFGLPDGKSCTEVPKKERLFDVGVPIGSLMSQTSANMVMNEVDQYAKHVLHIRCYIRYMDDIVILAPNKETLQSWMNGIRAFMGTKLKLKCNKKTQIIPLSHGIPFVGRRIWTHHVLMRKSTIKHMKRSLKRLSKDYALGIRDLDYVHQVMQSYFGLLSHVDSNTIRKWIAENIVFKRAEAINVDTCTGST